MFDRNNYNYLCEDDEEASYVLTAAYASAAEGLLLIYNNLRGIYLVK